MSRLRVLAVDLGATSVRVAAVDLDGPTPEVEVIHRWPNGPIRYDDGSLRWDWPKIREEVEHGLILGLRSGPVASIGIDGWAVDYGLLEGKGRLLSLPYSYRDNRTSHWQRTADHIGRQHLYAITGIQMQPFNTLFQLAAHDSAEIERAARLLLLPDLLLRDLTGFEGAEWSNATTTALIDAHTHTWSAGLLQAVGVDPSLFPPIVEAGRKAGVWRDIPVHVVGSHDTASAFVAMPGVPGPGTVCISSGTWVLVGTERPGIDTTEAARRANFTNEGGALGGVRFLKNVMGLWILEQCRAGWGNPPMEDLVEAAADAPPSVRVVDATEERFLAPPDMEAEIRKSAGLSASASRGEVVRCILDSIAAAVAGAIQDLGTITGRKVDELFIVGGGARIRLMNQLLGAQTGLPVVVGSPEATALGNAVVQGLALGHFEGLADARTWLAKAAERL